MYGRGLRERVLDHRIEDLAAARDEHRLGDFPHAQVRDVAAAACDRILPLDAETAHARDRRHSISGERGRDRPGRAARRPRASCRDRSEPRTEELTSIHSSCGCAGASRGAYPLRVVSTWIIGS
jgi:hypothetical protein